MNDFHLQTHVDHLYAQTPRQLAFSAQTRADALAWQSTLREKLRELLRIEGRVLPTSVAAETISTIDGDGYTEQKIALDMGEGVYAPAYILIPKTPPPYRALLAFHGHVPSIHYILGRYPDEAAARESLDVDRNYAQVLAQAGYLVCALEQRGFGERVSDQVEERPTSINSCRHLSFEYLMQGRTLMGERLWDAMLALTYLQNRPDVLPDTIGATGNSTGGTISLWLAALDERVAVSVPACYFCSFKASILSIRHCECNYVPDVLRYAEMGDLAALIAPRPVQFIAGEHDPIYPVQAAIAQFETVKRAYAVFESQDRCALEIHPGGHAYNLPMALAWLRRWIPPTA